MFAKAREKARQSSCLSNVKQLGLAILQYSQDYDERLVLAANHYAFPNYYTWPHLLQPYVKNLQIFTCPSSTSTGWNGTANSTTSVGYGLFRDISGISLGTIQQPASCIMLGDAGRLAPFPTGSAYYLIDWNQNQSDNAVPPNPLHNDGANLGFCDGHAKWLAKSKYGNWDTTAGAVAPDPSLWSLN